LENASHSGYPGCAAPPLACRLLFGAGMTVCASFRPYISTDFYHRTSANSGPGSQKTVSNRRKAKLKEAIAAYVEVNAAS
jgi:hypothetical protein